MSATEITPEERLAQINAKLAAGVVRPPPEVLRNSGRRRTPFKRLLLERIEETRRNTTPAGE